VLGSSQQKLQRTLFCKFPNMRNTTSPQSFICFRKYINDHKVAIVCSARSGSTKALGTTSLLLRAASEALRSTKPIASTPSSPTRKTGSRLINYTNDHSPSQSLSSRSTSPQLGFTPFLESNSVPDFFVTVDLIRQQHLNAARDSVC
jgi:aspartate kinase